MGRRWILLVHLKDSAGQEHELGEVDAGARRDGRQQASGVAQRLLRGSVTIVNKDYRQYQETGGEYSTVTVASLGLTVNQYNGDL